jgi:hypothetical protein
MAGGIQPPVILDQKLKIIIGHGAAPSFDRVLYAAHLIT